MGSIYIKIWWFILLVTVVFVLVYTGNISEVTVRVIYAKSSVLKFHLCTGMKPV